MKMDDVGYSESTGHFIIGFWIVGVTKKVAFVFWNYFFEKFQNIRILFNTEVNFGVSFKKLSQRLFLLRNESEMLMQFTKW